jgi:hypothetical protein
MFKKQISLSSYSLFEAKSSTLITLQRTNKTFFFQDEIKMAVRQIIDAVKKPFLAIKEAFRKVMEAIKHIVKKIKAAWLSIKRIIISICKFQYGAQIDVKFVPLKSSFVCPHKTHNFCNSFLQYSSFLCKSDSFTNVHFTSNEIFPFKLNSKCYRSFLICNWTQIIYAHSHSYTPRIIQMFTSTKFNYREVCQNS